jgi:putative oxidoreductase
MTMSDETAVNIALLAFRWALGAVFLAHCINHVFGGGRIEGTGRWFESLGMRPGIVHAWLASVTEISAGTLLVIGLLMPLAGAGVFGVMLVAWLVNHMRNGFFIFRPGEGWEYVMMLAVCGLAVTALGAGEWSLDHALDIFDPPGAPGLLIGVLAGGGGAALLLAMCWRPALRRTGRHGDPLALG